MKTRFANQQYKGAFTKQLLGQHFPPGGQDLTHQLAIATLLGPHCKVLELAAGDCASAKYLAANFGANVFALESDAEFLQQARVDNESETAELVHFIQGSAEHLPILSNSFDVVFCQCFLSTLVHREPALTEIYRILKPRGFIAISDIYLNKSSPNEDCQTLNRWLNVNSAYNIIRSKEIIAQGGFYQLNFNDVSKELLESIHTIESQFTVPDPQHKNLVEETLALQSDFSQQVPSRLAQFIYAGKAGYCTLIARKPG